MGKEFVVNTLEEMCDLMCDNAIPDSNRRITKQEAIALIEKDGLYIQEITDALKEPTGDLISRQAVLDLAYDMSEIDGEHFTEPCMVVDVEDIQKLPPVNPQEPKTGHWIMDRQRETRQCNKCMTVYRWSFNPHNYCPNCGCRMVEPQESEDKE